jgi:hypothetical protein
VNFDPKVVLLRALSLACTYQLYRATGALNKYSAHLAAFANSLKAYGELYRRVLQSFPNEESPEQNRKWLFEVNLTTDLSDPHC